MGKHPFTAQNEGALIRKILRGTFTAPTGYNSQLLDLVTSCLAFDQAKRPDTHDLLARRDINGNARELGIPLDQATLIQQHLMRCTADPTCPPVSEASRIGFKVLATEENQVAAQNERKHEQSEMLKCISSQHLFKAPLPSSPLVEPGKDRQQHLAAPQQDDGSLCWDRKCRAQCPLNLLGHAPQPAAGTVRQQHTHSFDVPVKLDCVVWTSFECNADNTASMLLVLVWPF
jgi:hypothetical protein